MVHETFDVKVVRRATGPNLFVAWPVQFLVVEVLGAIIWTCIDGKSLTGGALGAGAVIALVPNALIFAFSMLYWVPRMEERSITLQGLSLSGRTVVVTEPRALVIDLDQEYALEISRSRAGRSFGLRFFLPDAPPRMLVVESAGREPPPHACEFEEPAEWSAAGGRVSQVGTLDDRQRAGDAILDLIDATSTHNRFSRYMDALRAWGLEAADDPHVVFVAEASSAVAGGYRQRRPTPDQPSYRAWLEREGHELAPGVELGFEHAVVEDSSGRLVAFPLGSTDLVERDSVPTLCGTLADSQVVEVVVPGGDWALGVAVTRAVHRA